MRIPTLLCVINSWICDVDEALSKQLSLTVHSIETFGANANVVWYFFTFYFKIYNLSRGIYNLLHLIVSFSADTCPVVYFLFGYSRSEEIIFLLYFSHFSIIVATLRLCRVFLNESFYRDWLSIWPLYVFRNSSLENKFSFINRFFPLLIFINLLS